MRQEFTKDFMYENKGCYDEKELSECSFMLNEIVTLDAIVRSEIPLRHKFWFVCIKLASKEENQHIAIRVAEIVLPIYEKRYPDDKTAREAIEAAKEYIVGHIDWDILIAKKGAAAAAAAAAYAYVAYAYDASASASAYAYASAAADAASAAADAASSAYASAYAYAAAADASSAASAYASAAAASAASAASASSYASAAAYAAELTCLLLSFVETSPQMASENRL